MRHRKTILGLVGLFVVLTATPVLAQPGLQKTTVTYRNIDGHGILADVYRPKGNAPCPLIVWFHGGALVMGNREWIIPQIRALAEEKNFCLVSFDYRLAPETKLPAIVGDVEAAFQWLASDAAKPFHFDLNRMVVAGNSAGAYLTLVAGYRVNPKPKAIVSLYGYGRLNTDWYAKPNLYPEFNTKKITSQEATKQIGSAVISDSRERSGDGEVIYTYYRQTGLWPQEVGGFDQVSMAAGLAPYEPAKHVTSAYPPTLLIHGTDDHDVPYEESANMAAQFKKHDVPFILKTVDKAGHLLAGGEKNQIEDSYKTMRDFMIKYLGSN